MKREESVPVVSYENEDSSGSRVYLIGGIVVGVLVVVVLVFLVMSFFGDGGGVGERGGGSGEGIGVGVIPEGVMVSACEGASGNDRVRCVVKYNINNKELSICEEEFSSDKIFDYESFIDGSVVSSSANDYCWAMMSQIKRTNYCDRIVDNELKDTCVAEMAATNLE